MGDSEDKAFWTSFLRSLRQRGLGGVRLVISDAHEGLRASIDKVMLGAAWQRCRVHVSRNVLAKVSKGSAEMVAAAIRTIFAQPDAAAVADQLDTIADKLVGAHHRDARERGTGTAAAWGIELVDVPANASLGHRGLRLPHRGHDRAATAVRVVLHRARVASGVAGGSGR